MMNEARQEAMRQAAELTERQRDIIVLIAKSHTYEEIARLLGISEKTIASHRLVIGQKLGLQDIAAITRFAVRAGLVSPDE